MSEEIDLDASSSLNITEDAFEKFQSCSMLEGEEEFVTLSDIVPPQPSVPDHELHEIPYDVEVVSGSPRNDLQGQVQVSSHYDTRLQHINISENSVYSSLNSSEEGFNENTNHVHNSKGIKKYQDLSSDGLGAHNDDLENNASIIQDSLLSTTADQSNASFESQSKVSERSLYPRRTKRGRIPNTAKYPMTSTSESDSSKTTQGKRRGRPKKNPVVQQDTEPDSTNIDTTNILSENGLLLDKSKLDESTPNNSMTKGRRGRPKRTEEIITVPSRRGRKPTKTLPKLVSEEVNNSRANENTTVESNNTEEVEMDIDTPLENSFLEDLTLSKPKGKKRGPKKGKKASVGSTSNLKNVNGDDDDADDICLSQLKQDLVDVETVLQSDGNISMNLRDDAHFEEVANKETVIETEPKVIGGSENDVKSKTIDDSQINDTDNNIHTPLKRNCKIPIMTDFEYNVDKAVKEATADVESNKTGNNEECLLVEDTSKRRRTVKKTFVYDEGSDEDPFANVESSDDEPRHKKKGTKYYSDDEYVPDSENSRKRGGGKIRSSSSEDEDFNNDDTLINAKRKKSNLSPFKKGRKTSDSKTIVSTIPLKAEDDDIEGCLETTMIKTDESMKPPAEAWATSNAFQDFIAQKIQSTNLKIKKVSTKEKVDAIAPLEIPVVNQNEPKKTADNSTQTKASTSSLGVQTSAPYDIPMKTNVNLSAAQSEKACEFLKSVVKTTTELGQLMSLKSDDFMKKKINTEHVTDTFKMDYCVRKSFLLFKLAKRNLLQMEDDLAKQYDAFLNEHNLSKCREVPKKITPKNKEDSDSDCEIVEVVGTYGSPGPAKKEKDKSKFNPKTVFLNKELSIKIAKKPSIPEKAPPGKNKLDIKGRHAVWINKNVMVKKITPSQSFLAQDSRNKKPPDTYVTEKMVSDFFKNYYRKKALYICAPFISTNWTCVQTEYACHYFVNELDAANTSKSNSDLSNVATESFNERHDENCNYSEINESPKSLNTLCTEAICQYLKLENSQKLELKVDTQKLTCDVTDGADTKEPVALFRLCINALRADQIRKPDIHKKQEVVHNLLDLTDQDSLENTEYIFKNTNYLFDQNNIRVESNEDENINTSIEFNLQVTVKRPILTSVLPLTKICYEKIVKMFYEVETNLILVNASQVSSFDSFESMYEEDGLISNPKCTEEYQISKKMTKNGIKTLLVLCLDLIQKLQGTPKKLAAENIVTWHSKSCEIKTLRGIALEHINHILNHSKAVEISAIETPAIEIPLAEIPVSIETEETNQIYENCTINCVNTVSEEAFENLHLPLGIRIRKQSQDSNYLNNYDNDDSGDHNETDFNVVQEEEDNHEDSDFNAVHNTDYNGWASQLQMQEFRSCYTPHASAAEIMEQPNNDILEEPREAISHIKSEPVEYAEESVIDTSIVKSEPTQPLQALDEMTHIPDNIMTKRELTEAANDVSSHVQSNTYNVESFEQFVRTNKMIQFMDETDGDIFSQSGLRVRRQHEPDLDAENDMNLGLLVPHTFEPLNLVETKGSLMQSSSDEDNSNSKKGKKKDKRKKKGKKDAKTTTTKETLTNKKEETFKEKVIPEDEVTMLTRRMRDKIRQEEKKVQSSDSDSGTLYFLSSKKDKNKKDKSSDQSGSDSDTLYMLSAVNDTRKSEENDNNEVKLKGKKLPKNKNSKEIDDVQCNNVDSTEQNVDESKNLKAKNDPNSFSGFTAIDQNEITNYQKLMQFVYDKIIPSNDDENILAPQDNDDTGPIINPEDPVELLECEPTMPMFDNEPQQRPEQKKNKNKKQKTEVTNNKPEFTDKHGWHCYPIDSKETKLYKSAQILLEKLPESFVDTYMKYQDVMDKDLNDQEVDRLINLQTLNRSISIKKSRPKIPGNDPSTSTQNSENFSRSQSPTYSDGFDELVPSDDEGPKPEDEIPLPTSVKSSENNLAKNLLMYDHDSDSDSGMKKIKAEPKDPNETEFKSRKAGPKSKTKEVVDPESLMLTADKMMNKELNLLHAPVVLSNDVKGATTKDNSLKDESKSIKKISSRQSKHRIKNEDDSSSEEEKQWVNTKEKLLKRLGKKEDAIADDAKRVKLVNEFIERRNEAERKLKNEKPQGRNRRNRWKRLEAQRQLRFLSNELNKEGDGIIAGKRGAAAGLFKGRRNIRKVIDKKSLTRSTVVANMEEFERKRRLNMRQTQLRDMLGFEEGVNVLVINDEVCLEYDFDKQRPVVTVHQFFTKVMKAHQYEGVKFMWDACFESLATIEAGKPGGGCILAHCMGLGKTLQVLALLHTVLTHPRANMHRVLVCCPLSTVLNWVDEIHKWIGPVTHEIKVFELSKLKKTYERAYQLDDWYNGGGIFIIGYELFRSLTTLDPEIDEVRPTIINKIRSALLDPGPDIIVCDEGHLLKNDCSVLAVAMSRVATKRRIVLTGTPMQNNLREYFCMVNFIKPNLLGTYSEYSNRFENPIMNGQHRDSVQEDIKLMKARTHILHKVLEGCLQRQEASVLYPYLPKKHEYTVFIPLTQCQWELYHHYMDNFTKTDKKQILKDFHVLQKIWSHPQVLHNFLVKARDKKDKIKAEKLEDDLALADQEADIKPPVTEVWWLEYLNEGTMLDTLESSNKFVAVFRILHECVDLGDKVLIFSTSLFCLDALEHFLKNIKKWSLGQEYYRLDGSVPAEVRQKWCREFNAENNLKTKLFLISTRAGCLGLNMTAANRVIIMDTSWNPAHDIQSIFRVYRFGQKKDCFIYRLVALGTMEQKIYERSVTKQAVACRVVDEQQIDRHYNLAELTELYSVDEMGLSVAGGVAVGVNDIALLRVARDAPIHAVHEHDSLLRGSSEQGLPEHERVAAWTQFQLEHEHKQMQNDLSANKKSKIALRRLEMQHPHQQSFNSATNQLPPNVVVKSEPSILPNTSTADSPLLVPKEEPGPKPRGRKAKLTNVVQCRIPIATGPQHGTSSEAEDEDQQNMVRKITNLLIKHNFMQNNAGPKQISDLVSKVKQMVATRQPIALGPGYDELSASIANVLLHREEPPQPVAVIQPPPITPVVEKKRGRPRKGYEDAPEPPPPPPPSPPLEDGRRRRRAAIAAEKQLDALADVIDLDDDGDADEWQNDCVIDDEPNLLEIQKPKRRPKKKPEITEPVPKTIDSSIVLSDDETPAPEITAPAPTPIVKNEEVIALHPSLLTNQNFIKIVAHTYLSGNPMMDEDAATLAAQYSTLKTLKEAESEGKPIESGAVYDIAVQVLGKDVLRKLQAANPRTPGETNAAASKLQTLLAGNTEPEPPPTSAVKKPKIGPKSKVAKSMKQEPKDTPRLETAKPKLGAIKTSLLTAPVSTPPPAPTPRVESILPDEDLIFEPELTLDKEPVILQKIKLDRRVARINTPATPVALGRGPAPSQQATPLIARAPSSDATICLDSDEETPTSAPIAPPSRRRKQTLTTPTQSAPVPIALSGPGLNSRPVPLPPPPPKLNIPRPMFYKLSPCGTHAIPISGANPVPISMVGPSGAPQPIPVSLLGPGQGGHDNPIPVSFSGPSGSQYTSHAHVPLSYSGSMQSQPVPISLTGPGAQPVPVSLLGPNSQPIPMPEIHQTHNPSVAQPVPMSLVDSTGRSVAFPGTTNVQPLTLRITPGQLPVIVSRPQPPPPTNTPNKSVCKPGDVFRNAQDSVVGTLNRKLGRTTESITHTIPDDEPEPIPEPPPTPKSTPKPAVANKPEPKPVEARRSHRKRMLSRTPSSSSSSARSRSSSPDDPLAILKDVVHIQAPVKETKLKPKETPKPQKPAPKAKPFWTVDTSDPKRKNPKSTQINVDSVDLTTKTFKGPNKNAPKKSAGSVDLTLTSKDSSSSKDSGRSKMGTFKANSSKSSTSKKINAPSKLVGTTKNIILDGKSKSLKVEGKGSVMPVVVSSKQTAGSSTSKLKSVEKRPAPATIVPLAKKKKSEPMTLKDFDIDDIDDIIELD